jgi:hypothetical protein
MKQPQENKLQRPHSEVITWSARMVRDITLHPLTVRLYADAPYTRELFTEATWQQLVHPQQVELHGLAQPIILSKGHRRYYLPGSANDLILHASCVMSLSPALLRYLYVDSVTTDFGPPLEPQLHQGSFGPHQSMRHYWKMVESRTQDLFSVGFSHVLLTDIERCIENVDIEKLSDILRQAHGDEHAIQLLESMHMFWRAQGCLGLPLTAGFLILIKPYLKAMDASLRDEGIAFTRLQDDFRIFCHSHDEALAALSLLEAAAKQLGFSLNRNKTFILTRNQLRLSRKKKWLELHRTLSNGVVRPLLSDALQFSALRPSSLRLLRLLYSHRWQPT